MEFFFFDIIISVKKSTLILPKFSPFSYLCEINNDMNLTCFNGDVLAYHAMLVSKESCKTKNLINFDNKDDNIYPIATI